MFKEDVLKLFYSGSSPIIPACHLNVVRNAENEGLHGHHYFVQNTSFRPTSINVIGASSPNDYIVLGQKESSPQGVHDVFGRGGARGNFSSGCSFIQKCTCLYVHKSVDEGGGAAKMSNLKTYSHHPLPLSPPLLPS